MLQYFDKDFLKFLLGFAAIIIISLIVVAALRAYQDKNKPTAPAIQTAATNEP